MLVKKQPPAGRKLLVIGTSSAGEVMDTMGLTGAFNVQLHVPSLRGSEIETVMKKANSFAPQDLPQVGLWRLCLAVESCQNVFNSCTVACRGCTDQYNKETSVAMVAK